MKGQRVMMLMALCMAISACGFADTTMENGAITLKDDVVELHVHDAPDALIGSTGDLQIDDKEVPLTSSQRGLLLLYYQSVRDVHQTGLQMGKIGTSIGANAVKNALNGKSDAEQDDDAKKSSNQLKELEKRICHDQSTIKNAQDQLASQLSAFKPYGGIITSKSVDECMKDDEDSTH